MGTLHPIRGVHTADTLFRGRGVACATPSGCEALVSVVVACLVFGVACPLMQGGA